LNITKGGNGEGLYINKTSGSGNAATIIGTLNATTLVKSGGTSSQFLKADGTVDSTAYGTGSVTSVAALTIGTSGTDLSSSVANSTTTPVITLNVPTASATNRGALSSADWTTFNNKQSALTNPVTGTGTTNYLPKFTGASTIGNSILQETGGFLLTDKGVSTMFGVAVATSNSNGGSLTLKAGGGYGAGNTGGNLYLGFGRGNSSANNGAMYFGIANPTEATGLNATYMTLADGGNLGLGVTPSYKLDVRGTQDDATNFLFNGLNIVNTTNQGGVPNKTAIRLGITSDSGIRAAKVVAIEDGNNTHNVALSFYTNNTNADDSTTENMRIFSDGNVLLQNGGTFTNAGYKLDVNGTGRFSSNLQVGGSAISGNSSSFYNTASETSVGIKQTSGATSLALALWNNSTTGDSRFLRFFTEATATYRGAIQYDRAGDRLGIYGGGSGLFFDGAATFSSSVTATSFFESSSIKGKDIIATNPLLALDIDVIKYTRKSDESKDIRYGYSAEQIHSLMPELTDKDVTAVKYLDVHTILISQLQKEIKELKAKIN
jgi:hypothetical protein